MSDTQLVDESALSELKEIMGDDFKLLIDTFIGDSKLRLMSIKNAIQSEDSDALRAAAHSFKGSALNLSASRLTVFCKALEQMGRNNDLSNALEVFHDTEKAYLAVEDYLLEHQ